MPSPRNRVNDSRRPVDVDDAATLNLQQAPQRISFYEARNQRQIDQIDGDLPKLQAELWSAVSRVAIAQSTPVVALSISGMNDVINSQGYAQAAWWNRIPDAAWGLMGLIAIACNLLIGYTLTGAGARCGNSDGHLASLWGQP
jgi:hypothetical protein